MNKLYVIDWNWNNLELRHIDIQEFIAVAWGWVLDSESYEVVFVKKENLLDLVELRMKEHGTLSGSNHGLKDPATCIDLHMLSKDEAEVS